MAEGTAAPVEITDVPARRRYELTIDGDVAGYMEYRDVSGGRRILTHTEVLPAYEGRGLGGKLARHALEDARGANRPTTVKCPFVRSWLERHDEYDDLLAGHGGDREPA